MSIVQRLAGRLDIKTLMLFLTVVETRSLTEAAARHHLVVSAVSRRIARLEDLVGTPLLERRPGGVTPTAAGMVLVDRVRGIVALVDQAQDSLASHRIGVRGQVRLHAHTSALLGRLPRVLAAFMAANPGIDIQLEEWDSARVVRNVRDGKAHMGVFSSYVRADGLATRPFVTTRLVVVASRDHPLAKQPGTTFRETLSYEYVGLQDGDTFSALLTHMHGIARKLPGPINVRIKAASVGAMCRLVEAGIGIGVLSRPGAELFARSMDLVVVPLRDSWASIRHDLCVRDKRALTPAAQLLMSALGGAGEDI